MHDDAVLLRRYVEEVSEAAFAELVGRYVDLVYSAAMRRTGGDPHLSADIAQQVFTALAHHASRLAPGTVLGAWLHTATRNAALKLMISEQRRRVRETQVLALDGATATSENDAPVWEQLRPLLDSAIDELPEADRASLVLRFFERRPFAEIGAALRVSEDAARLRTDRALDRLRAALGRRGIKSTAAALAAIVSSQPLVSAPAGLAAALAAQSLAAAGGGAVAAGIVTFMSTKIVTTAVVSALIAFFAGSYFTSVRSAEASSTPPAVDAAITADTAASLRETNRRLQTEILRLEADLAGAKNTAAALVAQQAATPPPPPPEPVTRKSPTIGLARWEVQQGVLVNLRQIAAARDQYRREKGQGPDTVHPLVGRGAYIKALRTVGGEDYSELALNGEGPLTVTTPDGISVTFDPTGATTTKPEMPPEIARVQEIGRRVEPAIQKAVAAFRSANNGANPPNEQALVPYFATPQEGADFVEFLEARKAAGP